MTKKSKNAEKIIFAGEIESVVKWRRSGLLYPLILFIAIILVSMLPISGNILIDMKNFWIYSLTYDYGIIFISVCGTIILFIIISGVIQPLRITERGIYPPTRGIINIFLVRERFIPFSSIKEIRIYNPSLKKFPEEWARMGRREREAKELYESEYDIVLKNGKVIKMNSWTTAFYLSKNLPTLRYWREFRDVLLRVNEELKKGKTVIRKGDIYGEKPSSGNNKESVQSGSRGN